MTKQPGKAFWEGGAGQRDTSKMSRKDAHKYKGLTKVTKTQAGKKGK